jgi:hypothetical protein
MNDNPTWLHDKVWTHLVYPLAPNEANRDTYKSLIKGDNILLLGCTKILLPLATDAVDLVQRYPDPKIRVGDWFDVDGHYDTVLADGCICMGKEAGLALVKHFSTRCDRLIARCFTRRHPTMRIADHFPVASDFEIVPIVHSEAEWYRFYVWDFVNA